MRISLFLVLFLGIFASCSENRSSEVSNGVGGDEQFENTYFSIEEEQSGKRVSVVNPLNTKQKEYYYLGKSEGGNLGDDEFAIQVPVKKVACISTSHVAFLEALGLGNSIKGALNPELIYSEALKGKYQKGEIVSIGGAELNIEKLLEIDVDLVFASVYDAVGMKNVDQMRRFGINVVLVSEFLEEEPLEKAKWIKFIAAFYGKEFEKRADSIYHQIEAGYLQTLSLLEETDVKPEAMTGLPWNEIWYVPGGNSFQSNFIQSAGAEYIFAENREVNSFIVDFETMLTKGLEVPYWINVSDAESLEEIRNMDYRFANFRAFKEGGIYNNNARKNSENGNDYWESGVVRPDIVLKDLVKIFHSEKLPDHELYYYQHLK